jgi:hypothetical protein
MTRVAKTASMSKHVEASGKAIRIRRRCIYVCVWIVYKNARFKGWPGMINVDEFQVSSHEFFRQIRDRNRGG